MVDRFATINNACVSERPSLYTYRASLHGVIICMNHYNAPPFFLNKTKQTLKSKMLKSLFRFLHLVTLDGITVPYRKIGILDRFERLGETLSLFSTSSSWLFSMIFESLLFVSLSVSSSSSSIFS